jgi:ubiquinone/menaquinone biosynthesis C-methylase UbiE
MSLHNLDPKNRFSDRAYDYVKYRPTYPTIVIDKLLEGFELNSQFLVADIGAGTGISSRLLGDCRINVIAIEPNAAMREAGAPHPFVEYRDGSAENTNIEDSSVDLITCFQAFHWFNPETTLKEFRRIIKSTGKLGVIWNNRDDEDAFTHEYSRIVKAVSENHPAESRVKSLEPLFNTTYFHNLQEYTYRNTQQLDFEGLIGMAMSTSYIPREGQKYEQLLTNLEKLYQDFKDKSGFVTFAYSTSVHIVEPIA